MLISLATSSRGTMVSPTFYSDAHMAFVAPVYAIGGRLSCDPTDVDRRPLEIARFGKMGTNDAAVDASDEHSWGRPTAGATGSAVA